MAFSSLPAYLDSTTWNQSNQVTGTGNDAGGGGILRPGSMAERARLANIPLPESALRCPRCESTNTKFCYFNNYNLSQPRHFCKSCRRYWTRGGALRNVPVGGGCRRNKRTKTSTSKPHPRSDRQNTAATTVTPTNNGGLLGLLPQLPPLQFIPQLPHLSENFNNTTPPILTGVSAPEITATELLNGAGLPPLFLCNENSLEPWRFHEAPPPQFTFMGGLDPSQSQGEFHHFHPGESSFLMGEMLQNKQNEEIFTQNESVKREENPNGNLKGKQGGYWTEFCSHSTGNRI